MPEPIEGVFISGARIHRMFGEEALAFGEQVHAYIDELFGKREAIEGEFEVIVDSPVILIGHQGKG